MFNRTMKTLTGVLAAAAMLAVPAFSQADTTQGSPAEGDGATQAQQAAAPASADESKTPVQADQQGKAPVQASAADVAAQSKANDGATSKATAAAQPQAQAGQPSTQDEPKSSIDVRHTSITITAFSAGSELDKDDFIAKRATVEGGPSAVTDIQFTGGMTKLPADSSFLFANMPHIDQVLGSGLLDTSQVVNMTGMFQGDSNLRKFNTMSWDTSHVTSMSGMFSGCAKLSQLSVGSSAELAGDAGIPQPDQGTSGHRDATYTGAWIQVPVMDTQSANVDLSKTYTSASLSERTMETNSSKSGVYVWQEAETLKLKPSASLPAGLHADADEHDVTVLGGNADLSDVSAHDVYVHPFFYTPAPAGQFQLLDTNNRVVNTYRFAGWADVRSSGVRHVYQSGEKVDVNFGIAYKTLYEVWEPAPVEPAAPTPATPAAPAPKAPAAPAPATPSAPAIPVATPQLGGADQTIDVTPHPLVRNSVRPKCVEPTAYVAGSTVPAAAVCATEATVTQVTDATRHMPLWIPLLLLLAFLAIAAAIKRRDDFIVARHRGAETAE